MTTFEIEILEEDRTWKVHRDGLEDYPMAYKVKMMLDTAPGHRESRIVAVSADGTRSVLA